MPVPITTQPAQSLGLRADELWATACGPIALINGDWYSVNGNARFINDVRFRLCREQMLGPIHDLGGAIAVPAATYFPTHRLA